MASIFTFDPNPPRVTSPWSRPDGRSSVLNGGSESLLLDGDCDGVSDAIIAPSNVRSLEAEPQLGPTEYKLHLLMRPRKSLAYTSTQQQILGSRQAKSIPSTPRNDQEGPITSPSPTPQTGGSRQHRLEQLTTQLLWRLQQSSPYHAASAPDNLILPILPDTDSRLRPLPQPAKLLPGLETSMGALYEIGVADDGTLVGLKEDELSESLDNLRAMAFSLGCSVKVLRKLVVGECEWTEDDIRSPRNLGTIQTQVKHGRLFVAEAYIKPILDSPSGRDVSSIQSQVDNTTLDSGRQKKVKAVEVPEMIAQTKEQLRVSLTGATTCGKSSLLGSLSTSTLDNGRGKSRLSLLKHRHEIVSGMTSSVAQELIGYRDLIPDDEGGVETQVINFAVGNVSSWDDVHTTSEPGRLAFLLDGAGHPRYRRTTVRALVGWVPHWTFLCIAANDGTDTLADEGHLTSDVDALDFPGASAHISMAHLDLCLRLNLPLVIVITKIDIANKASLRQVLSAVLTSLKAAGRKPSLLTNDNSTLTEDDLQIIPAKESSEIKNLCIALNEDGGELLVPIVFTSSVKGIGIRKLHALLRSLPLQARAAFDGTDDLEPREDASLQVLFHVNDSFILDTHEAEDITGAARTESIGNIVAGHLAHGLVSIGDILFLGPFSAHARHESEAQEGDSTSKLATGSFLSPRSFNDALARATTSPRNRSIASGYEWRRVKVISIRNLRLPVRQLHEDQVGTLGSIFMDASVESSPSLIRKGMVLANEKPIATHTFTARFDMVEAGSAVVGSLVVVYCASVRASAKVIAISLHGDRPTAVCSGEEGSGETSEDGFGFDFDDEDNPTTLQTGQTAQTESILVTLQFLAHREFLEAGSKVLVMPSSGQGFGRTGKGIGGLEGFVGTVTEQFS